tara:strand:- start:137 stop:607 length:471 start_codon:yes stop_codon:yes gene_type:complete
MKLKKYLTINKKGKTPAFYLKKSTNSLSKNIINLIKIFSIKNKTDSRICLHASTKDKIQLMLNSLIKKKEGYHYNYHPYTDEYYYIISGKLLVFYYEKKIKKKLTLSKGSIEIFKLKKKTLHVTIPLTRNCVFLEIRQGPFNPKKDAIFTKQFEKI